MAVHLIRITIEGGGRRSRLEMDFGPEDALRKWTVLAACRGSAGALIAIAASLAPGRIAHLIEPRLLTGYPHDGAGLKTAFSFRREYRDDGPIGIGAGARQLCAGRWQPMGDPSRTRVDIAQGPLSGIDRKAVPLGNLVLGYGRKPAPRDSDVFDFYDTDYPFRRIASLLDHSAALTDPVAFLERMNLKAHRCGTPRQKLFLDLLIRALVRMMTAPDKAAAPARTEGGSPADLVFLRWVARGFPYEQAWGLLGARERRPLCVVADAARHAFDAFPRCANPLDMSGIALLDRPDLYCPGPRMASFLAALDELFPRLQFILTLGKEARVRFPPYLAAKRLAPPPERVVRPPPYRTVRVAPPAATRLSSCDVLLVQVDGTLPNLALMQLGRHLKARGRRVGLRKGSMFAREPAAVVYASSIFNGPTSLRHLDRLRKAYGERLKIGGTGVDLTTRLDPEVEALPPDYSLYPSLGDRAIGFLTRGCPGKCGFCVVPRKEGPVRQVADLDMLLQGRRKKVILLDDNLLSYPKATELLDDMVRRRLSVNFNQTLDLRRLEPEHADLLRRIRCSSLAFHRRVYHFSLNDARGLSDLRHRYEFLRVTREDNAEFVCMYGFNTSLAEDVDRLRFLRSLPRAYVFMQRYRPVPGGPPGDMSRLFDDDTERHLDELVRIVFSQNMKNVERYYRWLSIQYALQRRLVHLGLVDTLFRYNHRHLRGAFLEQLAEIAHRR